MYLILSKFYRWENRLRVGSDFQDITTNLYLTEKGCDFRLAVSKPCHVLFQLSHFASVYLSNLISSYFSTHTIGTGHSGIHGISTNITRLYVHPSPLLEYPSSLRDSNSTQLQGWSQKPPLLCLHWPSSPFSFSGLALQFPALAYCHHYFMDVNHSYQNILWAARGQVPCFNMPSIYLSAVISPL